jgi:hypothetical protein
VTVGVQAEQVQEEHNAFCMEVLRQPAAGSMGHGRDNSLLTIMHAEFNNAIMHVYVSAACYICNFYNT